MSSELSFSLLNSKGFIVTLMGEMFSEDIFNFGFSNLCGFSGLGLGGGEFGTEPGLSGSDMIAPSLLYRIRDRLGTFFSNTSGSESDVLSHSEHCLDINHNIKKSSYKIILFTCEENYYKT